MISSTDSITAYRKTVRAAYQAATEAVTIRENMKTQAGQRKDFQFLAANLAHFMPHIPASDYEAIYRQILIYHLLSKSYPADVNVGSMDYMRVEGDTAFLEPQAGRTARIFCSFHMGGYQSVMALLANAGYSLSVVTTRKFYDTQQDTIARVAREINSFKGTDITIQLLNAESTDIGKQMAMSLASGRSILILLDGNTGIGGAHHRDSRQLRVAFLNQTIFSRTGVATLSHAFKVPIIPITSYYVHIDGVPIPHYHCSPAITPGLLAMPQDEYVRYATSVLYQVLADRVRQHVDQWENWFYVHKFLDTDAPAFQALPAREAPINPAAKLFFDTHRFGLFKLESDGYLFDKLTYLAYPLTNSVYDWLSVLSTNVYLGQSMTDMLDQQPASVINRFYQLRLLIYFHDASSYYVYN